MLVNDCTPVLNQMATAGEGLAAKLQAEQEAIIKRQSTVSNIAMICIVVAMIIATLAQSCRPGDRYWTARSAGRSAH